jgi:hypothetical protein
MPLKLAAVLAGWAELTDLVGHRSG